MTRYSINLKKMYLIPLKYYLFIATVIFFISCSKDQELQESVYPKFSASLNYDSTTLIFSKPSGTVQIAVGKELNGCLRTEDNQNFCIRFIFDTLVSSIDLEDSLTGKTFYFTSNNKQPNILLKHELDKTNYNTFLSQSDLGNDFFININKVQELPEGDKIFGPRIIPWAISGDFKARIKNAAQVYENTTGEFTMLMEYYIVE